MYKTNINTDGEKIHGEKRELLFLRCDLYGLPQRIKTVTMETKQ